MDNLTITDVHTILGKCTMAEILDLMDFESAEQFVLSLEDYIDENLETIVENIFTNGLA